jgi:hypothetical protein
MTDGSIDASGSAREGAVETNASARAAQQWLASWISANAVALSRTSAYLAAGLVVAPFPFHLLRGSAAYLGLLEDDYFYYVSIADRFFEFGKLTYDGITVTNGFHPLWFCVVLALRWISGGLGPTFYLLLSLVFLASALCTFELSRTLAHRLGASRGLAAALAAVYSFATARLLADGMECALGVPLFFWLLIEAAKPAELTTSRAARLGFIASLVVLARLDLALAVALLVAGYVWFARPPLRALARQLVAFCAGGLALAIYAAANLFYFGSAIPVSAAAKRLITSYGFSFDYARTVALWTKFGPTVGLVLPLGLLALYLLNRHDPRAEGRSRFVASVALVFAFLFFALNALSGWVFFGWYEYPLPAAALSALVMIAARWGKRLPDARLAVLGLAFIVAANPVLAARYFTRHGPRWTVADNTLLAMSHDLAHRMRARQGLSAMGAIAGMASYVLDRPFFQVEGLVADHKLIEHLRRQDPLVDVLREYGADYLIVSFTRPPARTASGCYLVAQPEEVWSGPRTRKMRGQICAEPVEHFVTPAGTNPWSMFPALETFVWELRSRN